MWIEAALGKVHSRKRAGAEVQTTIASSVEFSDVGLHNGKPVTAKIFPSPANSGIVFVRTDLRDCNNIIPAQVRYVVETRLCTRLANSARASVGTVEHILAALASCGIHNARIEVDASELPALDGSALEYVRGILAAGIRQLDQPVRVLKIDKPVEVRMHGAYASLMPAARAEMKFTIDFPQPIGCQTRSLDLSNGKIVRNLADCRTFVLRHHIRELHENGFGLGGNTENVIIADVENNRFISELRHADEPCGHKMLDAVGDLSLAGYPIIGKFFGYRSGHNVTVALLDRLFAETDAYRIVVADDETAARLPGVGAVPDDIPQPKLAVGSSNLH